MHRLFTHINAAAYTAIERMLIPNMRIGKADAERFTMYLTDIRGFTAEEGVRLYRFDKADTETAAKRIAVSDRLPALFTLCGDDLVVAAADCAPGAPGAPPSPLCKFTIHGMGLCGDRGLTLHFARFCTKYGISPLFIALSDMALSFFADAAQRDFILNALCAYFPIWA